MSEFDHLHSLPEEQEPRVPSPEVEPVPPTKEPCSVAEADTPAPNVEDNATTSDPDGTLPAENATPEDPVTFVAPTEPPKAIYRWTYADEAAHSAKGRGKGGMVYAAIMTGVFLLSFGLLLAVLIMGGGFGGMGSVSDAQAAVMIEQAKHSVVVIEIDGNCGGTGIILTSDGYIATNHHVIESATKIRVHFYDGRVMDATLVGSSDMDDLAVVKVAATGLPAATFASYEDCYVGQTVYAIGTPAGFTYGWTTTKGIISYKDREIKIYNDQDGSLEKKIRLLQTDTTLNPGNSGGPLINAEGEVVGVVSMRLSRDQNGNTVTGIGFAIPSDGAAEILNAIIKYGNADNVNSSLHHKRPMLGVTGVVVTAETYYFPHPDKFVPITEQNQHLYDPSSLVYAPVSGVYVLGFAEGMDAAAKMQTGDIITACQGVGVDSMNILSAIVNEYYAGDTVTLTVYRDGKHIPVDIVLSEKTDS